MKDGVQCFIKGTNDAEHGTSLKGVRYDFSFMLKNISILVSRNPYAHN